MLLNILSYVLGIGFVVFGISALYLLGYELYKIFTKSNKKSSVKPSIYSASIAVFFGLVLIIMANTISS